jgi:hypothetical protein
MRLVRIEGGPVFNPAQVTWLEYVPGDRTVVHLVDGRSVTVLGRRRWVADQIDEALGSE